MHGRSVAENERRRKKKDVRYSAAEMFVCACVRMWENISIIDLVRFTLVSSNYERNINIIPKQQ